MSQPDPTLLDRTVIELLRCLDEYVTLVDGSYSANHSEAFSLLSRANYNSTQRFGPDRLDMRPRNAVFVVSQAGGRMKPVTRTSVPAIETLDSETTARSANGLRRRRIFKGDDAGGVAGGDSDEMRGEEDRGNEKDKNNNKDKNKDNGKDTDKNKNKNMDMDKSKDKEEDKSKDKEEDKNKNKEEDKNKNKGKNNEKDNGKHMDNIKINKNLEVLRQPEKDQMGGYKKLDLLRDPIRQFGPLSPPQLSQAQSYFIQALKDTVQVVCLREQILEYVRVIEAESKKLQMAGCEGPEKTDSM